MAIHTTEFCKTFLIRWGDMLHLTENNRSVWRLWLQVMVILSCVYCPQAKYSCYIPCKTLNGHTHTQKVRSSFHRILGQNLVRCCWWIDLITIVIETFTFTVKGKLVDIQIHAAATALTAAFSAASATLAAATAAAATSISTANIVWPVNWIRNIPHSNKSA